MISSFILVLLASTPDPVIQAWSDDRRTSIVEERQSGRVFVRAAKDQPHEIGRTTDYRVRWNQVHRQWAIPVDDVWKVCSADGSTVHWCGEASDVVWNQSGIVIVQANESRVKLSDKSGRKVARIALRPDDGYRGITSDGKYLILFNAKRHSLYFRKIHSDLSIGKNETKAPFDTTADLSSIGIAMGGGYYAILPGDTFSGSRFWMVRESGDGFTIVRELPSCLNVGALPYWNGSKVVSWGSNYGGKANTVNYYLISNLDTRSVRGVSTDTCLNIGPNGVFETITGKPWKSPRN